MPQIREHQPLSDNSLATRPAARTTARTDPPLANPVNLVAPAAAPEQRRTNSHAGNAQKNSRLETCSSSMCSRTRVAKTFELVAEFAAKLSPRGTSCSGTCASNSSASRGAPLARESIAPTLTAPTTLPAILPMTLPPPRQRLCRTLYRPLLLSDILPSTASPTILSAALLVPVLTISSLTNVLMTSPTAPFALRVVSVVVPTIGFKSRREK
jgi:hypothetical protein